MMHACMSETRSAMKMGTSDGSDDAGPSSSSMSTRTERPCSITGTNASTVVMLIIHGLTLGNGGERN